MSEVESLINIPIEHCSNIFGQFDEYAKVIEKTLKVTIIVRDSSVKVIGAEAFLSEKAWFLFISHLNSPPFAYLVSL